MDLTSASEIKRLLSAHGLSPRKRFGQNFLVDRNVLNRIVDACGLESEDSVLEIGPGLGVVTRELAQRCARAVCVEVDRGFQPILEEVLSDAGSAEVVIADFLDLDLPEFLQARYEGKWHVVANVPYYITSPIIARIIDARRHVSHALLMIQREVAGRLRAAPASQDYGALSVFVQFYCHVQSVMKVSKNVFYPIPEVDSELVDLKIREHPAAEVRDEELFFRIVKAAFGKRRKTLLNALSSSSELGWDKDTAAAALESAGIDGTRRGETLSIQEFAAVADAGGTAAGAH